jgi:fructosamine-3-kinase
LIIARKSLTKNRLDAVVHAYNPITAEVEVGESSVHGQLWLYSKFQDSLDYIARPCFPTKNMTIKKKTRK